MVQMNDWIDYEYGKWKRWGSLILIVSNRTTIHMPKRIVPDYDFYIWSDTKPEIFGAGIAQWKFGGCSMSYAEVKVKGWDTVVVQSKDSNETD